MATPCISQRCGLSGFKLQDNDIIVAMMQNGQQSVMMPNTRSKLEDYGFIECVGACPHLGGQATGCHKECTNQVHSPLRESLLKALAYRYEPTPTEAATRMKWLHQHVSSSPILRLVKPRLPEELRCRIAKYLLEGSSLHRYAVAYAQVLAKKATNVVPPISVVAKIWARFVDFEGTRYVSSLSNSCDEGHTERMFAPDASRRVKSVHIAENYLGVMQLLFCYSEQPPAVESCQGLWWRVIRLYDGPMLLTSTDGVKLRDVVSRDTDTNLHLKYLWSTPPSEPIRLVQLSPIPPSAQLSDLVCNGPRVTAYSVYWNCRIVYLHAHAEGEDLAFYNGYDDGIWVYCPLEQGEKVSEIWKYSQFKRGCVLIFKTTHNRVAYFGPQPKLQPFPVPNLIDLPRQDGGSRLFFEHSPLGVRMLAFETPIPTPASYSLALPTPSSQHPKSTFFEPYFYSTASLDGVVRIVPCQRYVRSMLRITGLLLQFSEGRQCCLGQVRLDSLGSPFQASSHQAVWLIFSKDDNRPFVSALELSEPEDKKGPCCLEIQVRGQLDWWFSSRQCQVCYQDKSSPPTRL
ncbi:hypothetical protein BDP81DRAFT_110713 [Colletotrichum phormii]|uniref:Uncharacterized protein n=1 Tax=Colletotrichum phormii TaxID=359342 RepID=A0AAI9ZJL4_9PEZI|nr:uncharacterized protein BDP81DRAFT_110713 [Colletotrichum phormii]KAK1624561.1 hypothetical protein BDP81DRAFT_110713 [Colletotrichum phormii]